MMIVFHNVIKIEVINKSTVQWLLLSNMLMIIHNFVVVSVWLNGDVRLYIEILGDM